MKLWKFTWVLAVISLNLFAREFTGKQIDQELDVVFSYCQDDWIMGLSDGSCWQLLPLKEKRKQTWAEWWNECEPKEWELSEEFFFDPVNWVGKYKVSVFQAEDSVATGYNFILQNEQNQHKIFAQFVAHGADFIPKLEYAKAIMDRGESSESQVMDKFHFVDDILILDDKTSWKLNLMNNNTKTFSQWWNGEKIDTPDPSFVSNISEWSVFDQVVVHVAQFENKELFDKYSVPKRDQTAYLIENLTKEKFAYASEVSFNNLTVIFTEYASSQRKVGFNQGYSEGYSIGKRDGESTGYRKGYQDGCIKNN